MGDLPEKNSERCALTVGLGSVNTRVTRQFSESLCFEDLDSYNKSTTADLINKINIQNLIDNDSNTWEEFGTLARVFMRNIVKKYGIDSDSAEDVYQEVLIKVMNSVNSYRGRGGLEEIKFTSWLGVITANTCKDYLRRRKAKPTISIGMDKNEDKKSSVGMDVPSSDKPEEEVLALLSLQDVLTKLSSFLDREDLKLMLFVAEGYSYYEIAEQMNLGVNTVKSRIHRARKKLNKFREKLNVRSFEE